MARYVIHSFRWVGGWVGGEDGWVGGWVGGSTDLHLKVSHHNGDGKGKDEDGEVVVEDVNHPPPGGGGDEVWDGWHCGGVGGWVGGWVEEKKAVGMRCCGLRVGGWVGGEIEVV